MNHQLPEKNISLTTGERLFVHSIFKTIQGEGPYTGQRATFVRLAGCNLQCPGCDTEYTAGRRELTLSEMYNKIYPEHHFSRPTVKPELVVITGGEPFRQNIAPLAAMLIDMGITVQVETNGTLPPSEGLHDEVIIVCSPKAGSINPKMRPRANYFKYVMHSDSIDDDDGLPILALHHPATPRVARPPNGSIVYLQPMDSNDLHQTAENTKAVRDSCLKFGHTLQLQIHKIIGVE